MFKPKHVRLAGMLILMASTTAAQRTDWNTVKALATGAEVRITADTRKVRGKVLRVSDESIVLAVGRGQEMLTKQEVVRVRLRGDSHRGRNSLIGLGGGAAIGAITGAATHQECNYICFLNSSRGQDAALGAFILGGLGAAVGALIPTRSWLDIYQI